MPWKRAPNCATGPHVGPKPSIASGPSQRSQTPEPKLRRSASYNEKNAQTAPACTGGSCTFPGLLVEFLRDFIGSEWQESHVETQRKTGDHEAKAARGHAGPAK